MCGGKLNENETYVFVKVYFKEGTKSSKPFSWFLADGITVNEGDRVIVPVGYLKEEGEVTEVAVCKRGVTPVPLRSAECIIKVITNE